MGVAKIIIDVVVNSNDAAGRIDDTASGMDKFGAKMGALAVPAGVAAGAIVALGKVTTDAASTTQQAMGAVESVFGSAADKVKGWAAGSAEAVGLSTSAYGQLASVAGASLKSMGLSQDDAADATGKLITLGADLSATFGGTAADAVSALTSALRGEADPAERLGLKLNQTTVAARMAADGTDKLTGTALEAAKAQTIMTLATEQAAGANGQFAREADTAAGSQEIANAQFEDAKSAMGEALLPIVVALAQAMGGLSEFVSENTGLITTLVVIVGGLAAAILAVNGALALASAAQTVWSGLQVAGKAIMAAATAAQTAFNAAMAANPVGIIIIAVIALIAAIVLLWNNCDAFREFFINLWETVSAAAEKAWSFISDIAEKTWEAVKGATEAVWNAIKAIVTGVIDAIKWYFETYFKAVQAILDGIKTAATVAWNGIKSVVQTVIDWMSSAYESFKSNVVAGWNAIRDIAIGVWNAIKSAAQTALDAIMWPINKIKDAINWVISNIQKAIGFAQNLMSKIPFIGGLFSSTSAATAPAAAARYWIAGPSSAARGALAAGVSGPVVRTSSTGGGLTINVNGAIDPVGTARQIQRILTAQARRVGTVTV